MDDVKARFLRQYAVAIVKGSTATELPELRSLASVDALLAKGWTIRVVRAVEPFARQETTILPPAPPSSGIRSIFPRTMASPAPSASWRALEQEATSTVRPPATWRGRVAG